MPGARACAKAGRTCFTVAGSGWNADRRRVACDKRFDRADLRQGAVRLGDGEVVAERRCRRLTTGLEMIDEPTRTALCDQADRALRLASAARAACEHARSDAGEDKHQCDHSARFDSSVWRLNRQATFTWGWSVAILKRPP
jgi:hypothetical protein